MAWTAPRTWTAGETLTAALLNTHLRDNLNAGFPVGSLHFLIQAATSTVTDVNGMGLEGNGSAASRTTYSALNTLHSGLSYPFGSGDGSTTFNLIDLRGRNLIHHSTSSGNASTKTMGLSDSAALASRTPKPSVSVSISVSGTTGSHTHTTTLAANQSSPGAGSVSASGGTYTSSGATASFSGSGSGSGTATTAFVVGGIYWVKY